MVAAQTLKHKLLKELERLPEDRLREVLDFVDYLLTKEQKVSLEAETTLNLEKDPILRFIGGVAHGALAKDIDKELYGG